MHVHDIRWVLIALMVSGCPGSDFDPTLPSTRRDDPKLSHTWTIPAGQSVISRADLGSTPVEAAEHLMTAADLPGIVHRIAQACRDKGALGGATSIALRFQFADGKLAQVEGDPLGPPSACLAAELRNESASLTEAPAAAALLRLQLHPRPS